MYAYAKPQQKETKKHVAKMNTPQKLFIQRKPYVIQRAISAATTVNALPELAANATINGTLVIQDWQNHYGANSTKLHPRLHTPDANRRVSADATNSIRFGNHERNSFGDGNTSAAGFHYHKETWNYDDATDTVTVGNTMQRITLGTADLNIKQQMINEIG